MVWLLLATGIILIVLNIRALKKEKVSFKNVFRSTEEEMAEFEVKIGELRREFSETVLELQKEILKLKKENLEEETYEDTKVIKKTDEKLIEETKVEEAVEEEPVSPLDNESKVENNTNRNSVKIEEINKLLGKGLSIDEISIKLGVGKGEVLLIKELYLK